MMREMGTGIILLVCTLILLLTKKTVMASPRLSIQRNKFCAKAVS